LGSSAPVTSCDQAALENAKVTKKAPATALARLSWIIDSSLIPSQTYCIDGDNSKYAQRAG
jgi:hypothetical protein